MLKKRTIFFLLVIVILFSVMTYQGRKGHSLTSSPLAWLINSMSSAITSTTAAITRPFKEIALRNEENRSLRKQIDELLLEQTRYQNALFENKRLRDLLKLRDTWKEAITAARIIGRGANYWSQTFIIDKGLQDGIVKDAVAITPKGLAGKIFNVSPSYASLLLVTDINFSASVRMQESRKEGVLSGTGTTKTVLKYIPPEEEIKTGEVVITSGLDRLFPPGIPIGYVSKVDRQGTGYFQNIEVIPFADNSRIEEVLIIR
jgi:rod shape-determining protein MreC